MKRFSIPAIGFLVLAGLIGFIIRLPSGSNSNSATAGPAAMPSSAPRAPASGPVAGSGEAVAGTTTTTVAGGSGGGSVAVAGGGAASSSGGSTGVGRHTVAGVPAPQVVPLAGASAIGTNELVGPRVIETAQLSVVAKRHGFDQAFARATDVPVRYGGFVESSETQGVRSKFGHLTIRVPASRFQSALRDLRALGRVEDQSISGQDVTSQYVDLQARLRNWVAQEQVLLRLMSRATTIGDTLRIQNELSQVQMRIEELKGQLRVLNNQTSLSTIDMSMREVGAGGQPPTRVHHKASTLLQAWRDARHGFVGVLASIVVGLGYLVPIGALLALVWLGVRRLRPRVAA